MAKAVKTIGKVVGVVATIASFIPGPHQPIAMAVAAVANTASSISASLLDKPPPARGSITQIVVDPDARQPYVMGEGYFAGVLRHDCGYGATLKKVPNPYRGTVIVYSGGGPVESITPWLDRAPIASWYSGFLYTDTQRGACPEASALSPNWAGMPGWGANSRLSGQAAILWNFLFDKEGERFASGLPLFGGYGRWVRAYDPRKDSTQPGGSGSHRLGIEGTYEWTDSPALHAGTYAYGRYQNGKRTFGGGLKTTGIDWPVISAWANVCEANRWSIFGPVFEPGNRWDNLKEIAAAGGAQPVISASGRLSFRVNAPAAMLDTIRPEDLADEPVKVTTMQSWSERMNTIIPKFISPAHDWQLVSGKTVSIASYVEEDGEEKAQEWPFNLVKGDGRQANELAAYKLLDSRELNPIVIPCGPRMRHYRAGEGLRIELPEYDLVTDAVILQRRFDPRSMTVYLTMISETPGKHDFALGRTATPPATPALTAQDGKFRDQLAASIPPRFADEIVFDGGETVEDLKPAEPGATAGAPPGTPGNEIVSSLPETGNYEGRVVFLTTDGRLYIFSSGAWVPFIDATSAIEASKITGQLTDEQIAELDATKIAGQLTSEQLAEIEAAKVSGKLTDAQIAEIAAAKIIGQLTDAQLAEIAAAKIAGQLTDAQIASIGAAKLTGQITSTQITDTAVTAPKIAAGAIEAGKIAAGAVTAGAIAASAVTASKIDAAAVTAGKIAANAVTAGTIAADAITSAKISAGAVTAGKVAADAILADNIGALQITAEKLAAGSVQAGKIAAGAVTAGTIASEAVTAAKIDAGAIIAGKIAAGAVLADNIAANAVTAGKIEAGAVSTAELAAGAVTTLKLDALAVTADKINTGAVTAAKISVTSLAAISANLGTFSSNGSSGTTIISGSKTDVRDTSNILRTRMGIW